jgi:hypothetical protein
MRKSLSRLLAAAASATVAGSVLLGGGVAHAATPPYEPDSNAYGGIVLYNSSGAIQLSGNLTDDPIAAYAVGTVAAPPVVDGGSPASSYTRATLMLAGPQPGENSTLWPTEQLTASTVYPLTTGPANLVGLTDGSGNNLPVETGASTNITLAYGVGTFAALPSSSPDFDVYQLRIYQSGPGLGASGYFEDADILANPTTSSVTLPSTDAFAGVTIPANGWIMEYPHSSVTATTTTLAATPASPQSAASAGGSVTFALNASVNAAVAGTVTFYNGSTLIGTVAATVGSTTDTASLAGVTQTAPSTHSYTATFTPAAPAPYAPSTSTVLSYTANNPAISTTTSPTAPTTATAFAPATYSASVVAADSTDPAGSVLFTATPTGGSPVTLGTATSDSPAGSGNYSVTSSALGAGTYTLTATFTPTSGSYSGSTGTTTTFTVGAAAYAADVQDIEATVAPGTLTITSPYAPGNGNCSAGEANGGPGVNPASTCYTGTGTFNLGTLVLNPAGTLLSASATFPNPADGTVTVTSTQAGDPSWTASVTASDLVSGANKIYGSNLGLTNWALYPIAGNAIQAGDVSFTNIPAELGASSDAPAGTVTGLTGGPHQFATTAPNGGDGTAQMNALLTLNAPTSTPAGTYNGTITFTVI